MKEPSYPKGNNPSSSNLKAELKALQEEQETNLPNVEFILYEHTIESIERDLESITAVLKNKDIILIEGFFDSREHRAREQANIDKLTKKSLLPSNIKKHKKAFHWLIRDSVDRKIHEYLTNSGKEVRMIDTDYDNKVYKGLERAEANSELKYEKAVLAFAEPEVLARLLLDWVELENRALQYRDTLMQLQIEQIALLPQNVDKKIAVLVGAVHTNPSIRMSTSNIAKITRTFPEKISLKKRDFLYSYLDEVSRNAIFNMPDKNTSQLIYRALLEDSVNIFCENTAKNSTQTRELIERYSDSEILSILQQIQYIGQSTEGTQKQKRLAVQVYLTRDVLNLE